MSKVSSQAELLFTLSGKKGKFKKIRDDVYKAKINDVNDNIIWFTGSPYREAGDWYIEDLINGWDDAFGEIRPNAAQVITQKDGSKDTLVYEMFKPAYNKKKDAVRFKFKLHNDQKLADPGKKAEEKDEGLKDASISPEERKLLFSLGGEQGTFKKIRKGVFEAEISDVNDNLVWFTDRPYREAGGVNIQDLINGWDDAFGKSRPNAAQVITQKNGEKDTLVYEMYKPFYDKEADTVQFKFRLHDEQGLARLSGNMEKFAYSSDDQFKKNYGDTSLFIDNWKLEDSDLSSVNSFSKDVDLFSVDFGLEGADDQFEMKFEDTNLFIDNWIYKNTEVEIYNFFDRDIQLQPIGFRKNGSTIGDHIKNIYNTASDALDAIEFAGDVIKWAGSGTIATKLKMAASKAKAGVGFAAKAVGAKILAGIGTGVAVVDAIQTKYSTFIDYERDPIIIPRGKSITVKDSDTRWGFANGVQDIAFLVITKPVTDTLTGVGSGSVTWEKISSVFFDNPAVGSTNAKLYPFNASSDTIPSDLTNEKGIVLDQGKTDRVDFNGGFMEVKYKGDSGSCLLAYCGDTTKQWELRLHEYGVFGF